MAPFRLTLVTPPATEPVSVAEFKEHSRISTSADDTYIGTLIASARRYAETYTRRQIIDATYDYWLDEFPSGDILLPKAPLSSVTTIQYTDVDNAVQTWASSNYVVDTDSEPGRVYLAYDKDYPSTLGVPKAVEIRYVAGYGTAGSDAPAEFVHAIKMLGAHWYETREPVAFGGIPQDIPKTVDDLLWSVRAEVPV